MELKEVLELAKNKGLLLEKDIFTGLKVFENREVVEEFLDNLKKSGERMITKQVLSNNSGFFKEVINKLPGENKSLVEKYFFNLGVSLEVRKESKVVDLPQEKRRLDYKVDYHDSGIGRKITVKDFVGHFRARYRFLQGILMQRSELQNNLVSLGKLSGNRQSMGFIGIVTEKRITKNKNMIIKFEDLTGSVSGIVKQDNEELFEIAQNLQLDDIIGVKASGNNELVFIHEMFFPDSFKHQKTRFEEDYWLCFISDIHCGSTMHLREEFERFLGWLNSDDEVAKKIKYMFIVGDTVDGVGVFPGQEDLLELKSMKEQYEQLYNYLKEVPNKITMFMCPGQHDATWLGEPQPIISKKYAERLYSLENLVLVSNPCSVGLLEKDKEFRVLMYHGASIHNFINEIKDLRLMKAHRCPARAVKEMLRRRHLAPSHGVSSSIVYTPNGEKDPLVIEKVPDILCTGEVHRLDVDNYNGVLITTGSCWQSQTPFEEKVGNLTDPCKVALFNIRSGEFKVLDFGVKESYLKNEN
jgi:DNA polymerase II small subunit